MRSRTGKQTPMQLLRLIMMWLILIHKVSRFHCSDSTDVGGCASHHPVVGGDSALECHVDAGHPRRVRV